MALATFCHSALHKSERLAVMISVTSTTKENELNGIEPERFQTNFNTKKISNRLNRNSAAAAATLHSAMVFSSNITSVFFNYFFMDCPTNKLCNTIVSR